MKIIKTIITVYTPDLEKFIRASIIPLLAVVFLVTALYAWMGFLYNHPWNVGDWLINYHGGFVRRGLIGEIVLTLSSLIGLGPAVFVAILQALCYLIFFFFTGLLLWQKRSLLPYAFLIFSPFIFMFQLHNPEGGFRKEILYFAVLAFFTWSSRVRDAKTRHMLMKLLLLFFPLLILSHEILAIFLPYLLIVYLNKEGVSKKTILSAVLFGLPSFTVFLISLANPGTTGQVLAICNSLGENAPDKCGYEGAIASLSWTTDYAFQGIKYCIAHLNFIGTYSFVVFMSLLAFLPIAREVKSNLMAGISLPLFLFSIAGTLLLFFIARDWGRFIHIHLVSIFLVTLGITGAEIQKKPAIEEQNALPQWLQGSASPGKYLAYIIVFLLVIGYSTIWYIPYTGGPSLKSHNIPVSQILF